MTYDQCLETLATLGHELRGGKFDLRTTRAILRALKHPERRYPTAIVAGTNGKGSTSALLARILEAAGYRTALYTSPHLVRVNERFRIGEEEISDGDFAQAFTTVWDTADRLLTSTVFDARPSFFELLTATAFLHFARACVDFAVLEVGMGGRLDATNVTDPRVAVITNIALDHQQFLGSTIAAIATEKAGIIKPGRPVVSSCENPEAREVVRKRAAELHAPLVETLESAEISYRDDRDGRFEFDLKLNDQFFLNLRSSLMGRFQVKNAVAAVAAAQELVKQGWKIPEPAIREGLRQARWPGRLEVVSEHPLAVLDGAHNPAAAREVEGLVREHWAGRRLILVYATMRDKAIDEIASILFPLAQKIYLTRPEQTRAAAPEEILAAARLSPSQVVVQPDPKQAFDAALAECSPEDVVLAAGSLFLVGEIKRGMRGRPAAQRAAAIPAAASQLA
ncbi:MAG: bifunctional folylpolyglutamate synthase/dihydrofolate synthase [Deltaproteobacteria bacterium]